MTGQPEKKNQHYIIQTSSQVRITNLQKNMRNKERLQSQDEWLTGLCEQWRHESHSRDTLKFHVRMSSFTEWISLLCVFVTVTRNEENINKRIRMQDILRKVNSLLCIHQDKSLSCVSRDAILHYYKLHIGKSKVFIKKKKVLEAGL